MENDTLRDGLGIIAAGGAYYGTRKVFINSIGSRIFNEANDCFANVFDYNKSNNDKLTNSLIKMYMESGLWEKGITVYDYQNGIPCKAAIEDFSVFSPKRKQDTIRNEKIMSPEEFIEWTEKNPKKAKRMEKSLDKQLEKASQNFEKYGTNNKMLILQQKSPKLFKYRVWFESLNLSSVQASCDTVATGANACAVGKRVHINLGENKAFALAHELGHASNKISKGIGKITSLSAEYSRKANVFLLPLILATAIFRNKKAEGEESETISGKCLDFVKDNCTAMTAATQVPTLAEEGLASIKGLKMSKKYVTKKEFGMLKNVYKKAFMTYAGAAALTTLAVFAADMVKNLICPPEQAKA